MKTPPTMSQVLALLSVIVIPIMVWGVSVETRLTSQIYQIEQNARTSAKIEVKIDEINKNTIDILLELERLKK
tara:strand:- start:8 stop:226 length:219 start_codon:yes stop_codon:yes gene_type:complete